MALASLPRRLPNGSPDEEITLDTFVEDPPTAPQLPRLLARNPRAGIGFIKVGARGVGPAMKAFDRGDEEGGLRSS